MSVDKKELDGKIDEILNKVKKSSRKKIGHFIYGTAVMNVVFLLLQILILYNMIRKSAFSGIFTGLYVVLGILAVLLIVNEEINPMYKIAWIIPVVAIPVYGTFAYIFMRLQPRTFRMKKNLKMLQSAMIEHLQEENKKSEVLLGHIKSQNKDVYNTARYLGIYKEFPIYQAEKVTYYPSGELMFRQMLYELAQAEKFIFVEYFIVERGLMWNSILEILKEKAKNGVEVRVLYDGTCSFTLLPESYPKQLEKLGIQARVFSPITPVLSTHQNSRSHRKSLIIDGKVAFTGGVNLADEYINEVNKFGYWKDVGVKITGEAVNSFIGMFLTMWNLNPKKAIVENMDSYMLPCGQIQENHDKGYLIPYGDTPFGYEQMGEQVYLDILTQAKDYVYIMTPYLILDDLMIRTLITTAKRGVDVRIVMPHIPDKRFVFALSRSYYWELIQAGVKIYEFRYGFVHAKVFLSDDEKAVVGSINLDYRSLYLHFENAVYMYKTDGIQQIKDDFADTFAKCIPITEVTYKKFSLGSRMLGRVLRLVAPLM